MRFFSFHILFFLSDVQARLEEQARKEAEAQSSLRRSAPRPKHVVLRPKQAAGAQGKEDKAAAPTAAKPMPEWRRRLIEARRAKAPVPVNSSAAEHKEETPKAAAEEAPEGRRNVKRLASMFGGGNKDSKEPKKTALTREAEELAAARKQREIAEEEERAKERAAKAEQRRKEAEEEEAKKKAAEEQAAKKAAEEEAKKKAAEEEAAKKAAEEEAAKKAAEEEAAKKAAEEEAAKKAAEEEAARKAAEEEAAKKAAEDEAARKAAEEEADKKAAEEEAAKKAAEEEAARKAAEEEAAKKAAEEEAARKAAEEEAAKKAAEEEAARKAAEEEAAKKAAEEEAARKAAEEEAAKKAAEEEAAKKEEEKKKAEKAKKAAAPSGGVKAKAAALAGIPMMMPGMAGPRLNKAKTYSAEPSDGNDRGMYMPVMGAMGGYHTVVLPLSMDAADAMKAFKAGECNFVALYIRDEAIDVEAQGHCTNDELSARIHATEPRFYLFETDMATGAHHVFFIFSSPECVRFRQRITYSTAKGNVSDEAGEMGIAITRKLEISEGAEVTAAALESSVAGPTEEELNAHEVKPRVLHPTQPNPLVALLAQRNGRSPAAAAAAPDPKLAKIVLPPKTF